MDTKAKLLLAAACFALASCQDFFTTSVAAPLARDSSDLVPTVTSGNAADLADQVANDPDASLVVLEGLADVIAAASAEEAAELAALALEVASNASGIGGALLENSSDILEAATSGSIDEAVIFDTLDEVIAGLGNLDEAAAALIESLSYADVDDVAAASDPDALAMAAVVLLASEAASYSGGVSAYVDALGSGSVSAPLAITLATAASTQYAAEGGTGLLADLLTSLNLT